ncbi:hypothetical protein KY284_035902 [Solanum tuberosum]|nr:hypothetical protein KY284_035902 [Solanum tuberosum]
MDTFNSPNPQMVIELLGGLTYLIFVIPNPHMISALLEFWDPMRIVFKFVDFYLAPTIIDMPYHEFEMMVTYKPSSREFLQSLGMKSNSTLPSLDLGWIHFDFLYSRFGQDDSYYSFSDEFECSVEEWETYRPNAFAIALLGSLVFPNIRGKIDTILGYVVRDLAQKEGEPRKTIVPMILAKIMRSLSAWSMIMVYHTCSNDTLPSLPNENRKGKRKATNEKLLLSVDPTLETNIDKPHITSQATLQDNPPPTHPTSQNQPSSIQMPPKNTHFPNYPYPPQHHAYASRPLYLTLSLLSPPLQAPQYQTPLHQVPWIAGHIAPISEIRMNTRARWIEPSKVCAYHSRMKGHSIEECRDLIDKIQQLIDTKIIYLEDFKPMES